jgi:hypothetical protein
MSESRPSEARMFNQMWLLTALFVGVAVIIGCGLSGGLFFLTILFCQLATCEHQRQEPQTVKPS